MRRPTGPGVGDSPRPERSTIWDSIQPASWLLGTRSPAAPAGWRFSELTGYITELSAQGASATTTFAMRLVWEAQTQGEPVAWISSRARCFFPPDAAANGVDLAALAVVRVDSPDGIGKAADLLVRSGAFGLLVLDLGLDARLSERQLTRLLGLARTHEAAIVCLTHKSDAAASLGSLVALRASVSRERTRPGVFTCELRALKDKRRAPGWRHEEVCRGPAGLR